MVIDRELSFEARALLQELYGDPCRFLQADREKDPVLGELVQVYGLEFLQEVAKAFKASPDIPDVFPV